MRKGDPLSSPPAASQHSAITEAFFTHGDYSMQFDETPESEPFLASTPRPSASQQPPPTVPGVPEPSRDHQHMNASVRIPMQEEPHIPYETLEDGKFLSRSMLVNTGGEDLYRFLIQRSVIQPKIVIKFKGTLLLLLLL